MSDNILIGKTIIKIEMTADSEQIRFFLREGDEPIVARCDADCCSHTWIENVSDPGAIIGHTIVRAGDVDMPDLGSPNEYDCIAYYGFEIATAMGRCIIDYRNSSNGYYGGWLHWTPDLDDTDWNPSFYGGVYGQNDHPDAEWKDIQDHEASDF